jgi:hypothetical protein
MEKLMMKMITLTMCGGTVILTILNHFWKRRVKMKA